MTEVTMAFDHFSLKKSVRTIDDNGFLHVAVSPVTREQVAPYHGYEIPHYRELGYDRDGVYYGYRSGEELSKPDTIKSLNGIPIQFEHHVDYASAPAKQTRVGCTGTDAKWEAPYLTNSLHIQDKQAIDRIIDGSMKELSLGYRYDPVRKHGTFNGQDYDFVMTNISCNHLALVEEGRAGREVCVCDAKFKPNGDSTMDPIKQAEETLLDGIVDLHNKRDGDPADINKPTGEQMDSKIERLLEALKADGIDVSKYQDIVDSTEDEAPADIPADKPVADEPVEEGKSDEDKPAEDDDLDADEDQVKPAEDEDDLDADVEPVEEKPAEDEDPEDGDVTKDEGEEKSDIPAEALDALKSCGLDKANDEVKDAFLKGYNSHEDKPEEKKLEGAQDAAFKAYASRTERRIMQRFNAADECASVLGRVKPMAFDSAGDIYRQALKKMGVAGASKMKSNEARSVFRAVRTQSQTMGMDAAPRANTNDAAINILKNIKIGV